MNKSGEVCIVLGDALEQGGFVFVCWKELKLPPVQLFTDT